MGLIAKEKERVLIPEGTHFAILYGIYDLGLQESVFSTGRSHRILFQFELPGQQIELNVDGKKITKPMVMSKEYSLNLHPKANLRLDLENWRDKSFTEKERSGGFDIFKMIGEPASLKVQHKEAKEGGGKYHIIKMILPSLDPKVEPKNSITTFSFDDKKAAPKNTPDWILKKLRGAEEWSDALEPVPF